MPKRAWPSGPTTAELTSFLHTFFPTKEGDVQFLYHVPFGRSFDPARFTNCSIALSITPTSSFYRSLQHGTRIGFLHRPFGLVRHDVPRNTTILANHKAFDEFLTTGYNLALAERLGLNVQHSACIQGCKGDPHRRIGIVAAFGSDNAVWAGDAKTRILSEFQGRVEGTFGFDDDDEPRLMDGAPHDSIGAVAIMNAFHAEEVDRALRASISHGFLRSEKDAAQLLYLTGAIREPGLIYARERGIKVICVGHRICEEWGVRYLASRIRDQFPGLRVDEILEEEEPHPQRGYPRANATE